MSPPDLGDEWVVQRIEAMEEHVRQQNAARAGVASGGSAVLGCEVGPGCPVHDPPLGRMVDATPTQQFTKDGVPLWEDALVRIADALGRMAGTDEPAAVHSDSDRECGETTGEHRCVLVAYHRCPHLSADGRTSWAL